MEPQVVSKPAFALAFFDCHRRRTSRTVSVPFELINRKCLDTEDSRWTVHVHLLRLFATEYQGKSKTKCSRWAWRSIQ